MFSEIKYLREKRSHKSERSELKYQRSERSSEIWEIIWDLRDHLKDQDVGLIADRLDSEMLRGFCDGRTDRRTDRRTFAILESLSRLKNLEKNIYIMFTTIVHVSNQSSRSEWKFKVTHIQTKFTTASTVAKESWIKSTSIKYCGFRTSHQNIRVLSEIRDIRD